MPELKAHDLKSVDPGQAVGAADIVCIVTAHPEFDYEQIVSEAALVLDFRGVTRGIEAKNLVRL